MTKNELTRSSASMFPTRRLIAAVVLMVAVLGPASVARAGNAPASASDNVAVAANLRMGNVSDMAFWGDLAAINTGVADGTTANDGFALVDISDPSAPRQISQFHCPRSAYDISIWRDLVILSAEGRTDPTKCSAFSPRLRPLQGEADILVVDISRPESPMLIAAVLTECRTSHTHTLVPDLSNNRLVVYNSGAGCVGPVTIPLNFPERAQRESQFFTGLDPLDNPRAPSEGSATCHDITVFVEENVAACATDSLQVTQLWDISDPLEPVVLSTIENRVLEHHHSTAFSWDGNTLVLGEEKLTTLATETCTGGTGTPLGALWFYDISDPRAPQELSYYQLPRAGVDGYCSAHYFSVVPLRGGADILTAAWYGGGTTVVDFTNPKQPEEIAFYDQSLTGRPAEDSVAYSAYWYNGFVYVSNFGGDLGSYFGSHFLPGGLPSLGSQRGLEILRIDDDRLWDAMHLPYLNVQTQMWNAPSDGQPGNPDRPMRARLSP